MLSQALVLHKVDSEKDIKLLAKKNMTMHSTKAPDASDMPPFEWPNPCISLFSKDSSAF